MERRFQFSLRDAFIATAWLVAWLINCKWGGSLKWFWSIWNEPTWAENAARWIHLFLHACLPAAFVGAITRRQAFGLLCGVASGLAVAAWELIVV